MVIYSPEWMIQPAPKPADPPKAPAQETERAIPVRERRTRVDRRRTERRHKR